MAVAYTSPWYAALAGFYAWLVIIRGTVIFADRVAEKRKKDSASAARNRCVIALICGVAMITAGCAVSAPVIQMAVGNYPQSGGVSNLVVNAVFALVKCVSAVTQQIRAFAFKDPVTRGLRNLSLIIALMSLLTLQVSIISMLEAGASLWQLVVVLGAAVSTAILAVGACSVIRNALELKKYPKQKE